MVRLYCTYQMEVELSVQTSVQVVEVQDVLELRLQPHGDRALPLRRRRRRPVQLRQQRGVVARPPRPQQRAEETPALRDAARGHRLPWVKILNASFVARMSVNGEKVFPVHIAGCVKWYTALVFVARDLLCCKALKKQK